MEGQVFIPNPRYRTKLYLSTSLIALLCVAGGGVLGALLGLGPNGLIVGTITVLVTCALNFVWWAPLMLWCGPYYRSLSYEICEDEVIVRAGVLTRTVKHVPYRTVTNITVKRGLFDRWLGIGTLEIQTAGMSGTTGVEQILAGLENAQEVYALVATELRRFRSAMAPTAAGEASEVLQADVPAEALNALLVEVRAIRRTLEERN
jgi:membrane protein YdbS with pleckstrin-like domain